MMMVDTINPNTNEPDLPQSSAVPPVNPAPASDDRFYGGFDRPDDVKINLAAKEGEPTGFAPVAPAGNSSAGVTTPATTPVSSNETQVHSTYSKKNPVNTRGIAVIAGVGVAATLVLGLATYFVLGSTNTAKIEKQQAQLDELNKKLASLEETPDSLQVATTETPEATEETTTEEVVVPETKEEIEVTGGGTEQPKKNENGTVISNG